jgi:hypothetical protein
MMPCGGSYIKGRDVHEVGEVDVGVVAMTTLGRWIPNLTDRSGKALEYVGKFVESLANVTDIYPSQSLFHAD